MDDEEEIIKSQEKNFIMVVDDEDYIREMIAQALEKNDFACIAVSTGEEALEIMENTFIDVLITDIRMPNMDGIELMRQVVNKYATDVIIMTGFIEDYKYEQIINAGASDFIQKPMEIKELILRLKRVLRVRKILVDYEDVATQLKKSFRKLKKVLEQTVNALISVVEIRDPYTAGHQQRVSLLACKIAGHMNLSQNQIDGLRIAGLLHDIGKMAIPSMILNKSGVLHEAEFDLIKQHSQYGYDIIKEIDFPWPVSVIVLQHHERINGSGYPAGLTGDKILIEAKILTVSDVIEAMSFQRPYRPALPIETALNEIEVNKGILYDPDVVDACIYLIREQGFDLKKL
ncbi:MAG: response regulator [Spirochaetales bacterium]|nr:response regulator [Spirochaetales bacterium]